MATSTLGNGTLVLAGTTSGTTTVTATAVAGTTTLTLPAATDTLVGKATTDTLTNKTLTGAVMNGTVGATTPSTGAFTTLSATGAVSFTSANPSLSLGNGNASAGSLRFNPWTATNYNWLIDNGVITAGTLSITPSSAVGGNTYTTPVAAFSSTGLAVTGTISGTTTIGVGAATPSTSGAGITFPATQSASTDANTLDDYEEGTLTTSFSSPVNLTGTPALGKGRYTKVGRLVSIQGEITGYSITTANTLTYFVMTLPFVTVGNIEAFSGSVTETGSYSVGTILDSSSGSDNTIFLGFRAASVPSSGSATYHISLTYMSA